MFASILADLQRILTSPTGTVLVLLILCGVACAVRVLFERCPMPTVRLRHEPDEAEQERRLQASIIAYTPRLIDRPRVLKFQRTRRAS